MANDIEIKENRNVRRCDRKQSMIQSQYHKSSIEVYVCACVCLFARRDTINPLGLPSNGCLSICLATAAHSFYTDIGGNG